MQIRIKKDLADQIGIPVLVKFGLEKERAFRYGEDYATMNLAIMKPKQLEAFEVVLAGLPESKTVKLLKSDVNIWRQAISGAAGKSKARTIHQLKGLIDQFIVRLPGQRLMAKAHGIWVHYYVNQVQFVEPQHRDREAAPYVLVSLAYEEFGSRHSTAIRLTYDDVRGKCISEVLAGKGYYPETEDQRAIYLDQVQRTVQVVMNVGRQYLATGIGTTNCDGNEKRGDDDRDRFRYRVSEEIDLVRNGEPTRVVGDVFFEKKANERGDSLEIKQTYWSDVAAGINVNDDDDYDVPDATAISETAIEVPVHPYVAVFDLTKHLRLRVHVDQVEPYVYDQHLADKLILSAERKTLVQMLIEMKGGLFRDIVQGKGGGAVVLLAGAPGTGKTLTAEVYAEAEQRPLYSVQCSQLGIDPDDLEEQLLKVFDRARRWQAVMLLDEADVYIHERGNNMQQNAVVGVFLRVLEYQGSVLFLTTNRPDDVDDAIASRCIAKLTYQVPTPDEQTRIWRVLSNGANLTISEKTIQKIVADNQALSGRDVKNLLKLAGVMAKGKEITADAVEFVKQFKPTGDVQ